MNRSVKTVLSVIVALLVSASYATSPAQQIASIDPPSILPGIKTELTIRGSGLEEFDFAKEIKVVSSCGLILKSIAKVAEDNDKPNAKTGDSKNLIKVIAFVDADSTDLGINYFCLIGKSGVSNYFPIAVDHIESKEIKPNEPVAVVIQENPVAVVARINGDERIKIEFEGKSGQTFLAEVESVRLGSKLKPDVHLFDANGIQVAWAGATSRLQGDARMHSILPSDGKYTLHVHDAIFKASKNSLSRVKLGNFEFVDQVDTKANRVSPESISGPMRQAAKSKSEFHSGFRPTVRHGNHVVVNEGESKTINASQYPFSIVGKISESGQLDRFVIPVADGQKKLFVAITSTKLNSPLDSVMVVRNKSGKEIARMDDANKTFDPQMTVNVPKGSEVLIIEVRDLLNRGGDEFNYVLDVGSESQSHFVLSTQQKHLGLPVGVPVVFEVQLDRRGYLGPVDLEFDVAEGVTIEPNHIPANVSKVFLSATASGPVPVSQISIRGWSTGKRYSTSVTAQAKNSFPAPVWLDSMMSAGESELPEVQVSIGPLKRSYFFPFLYAANVDVVRQPKVNEKIRLELMTTQRVPLVAVKGKNQPDNKRRIQIANKKLELSAKQKSAKVFFFVPQEFQPAKVQVILAAQRIVNPMNPMQRPDPKLAVYSNILNLNSKPSKQKPADQK